ncbi:MgtC/SapB family protein, partial [bacterium]
ALGLGLFIGMDRERRGKEVGVRTFAFFAALGCVGGLLGDAYALASLALLVPFVIFLNIHSLRRDDDVELTTSAALLVVGYIGVLCGKGHTFTPVALGLATAGLLAWKGKLTGFSLGITDEELRAAILLGILAFVIHPVLPAEAVDPWGLIEPRGIWTTVILIAAIGFGNYVLLKLFGERGLDMASFLGGLVNSTVTITELATRTKEDPAFATVAFRGAMLATSAMLLRNAVLLAILAPRCLLVAGVPMGAMLLLSGGMAFWPGSKSDGSSEAPKLAMRSPFSLGQALKFGGLFLALNVVGSIAQRNLGSAGFYAVSGAGGLVSSASAVASAGELAGLGRLTAEAAGIGAIIASITSVLVAIPLVNRISGDGGLSRRIAFAIGGIAALGIAGAMAAPLFAGWLEGFFPSGTVLSSGAA